MKNSLKISENIQDIFLSVLKQNISSQHSIVDVLSDLLDVSQDAAYRRLRGDKKFDIEEIYTICTAFNISVDSIFSVKSQGTIFNYTSLDVRDQAKYLLYMQNLSKSIELIKEAKDKEIIMSAIDIPVFHFLSFKELTLFKLFAWNNTTYNQGGFFETFLEEVSNTEILCCYEKLAKDYAQIPSTELWTVNTVDTLIRLLDFYFETGFFQKKETAILLCNQALQLIDNLKKWADQGYKSNASADYKFYVSDTDLENNFILLKKDNDLKCIIKLFTINSLTTSDGLFCQETLSWLEASKKRSVLLSGASERERFRYFNIIQQKVRCIMDKFEKSVNRNLTDQVFSSFQAR
jgi:hypothetical protein